MANKHFTKVIKLTQAGTEIVRGAPVKITRARDGSCGKDTEEELVEKPDEDWLDADLLNDPSVQRGRQTGYGRWAERIGTMLKQIDQTEDISQLPEMLTNEEVAVQDAAERRLGELERAFIGGLRQAAVSELRQRGYAVELEQTVVEEPEQAIVQAPSPKEDKEKAPESRFDIIDIPEEEKE